MEPNNLEGRSRGSSFRRRALTLVGVSALTLSGVGAAVFGASQAFATAGTSITGAPFTLGTSVTNVTLAANNTVDSHTAVDTVTFVATGGITSTGSITIATTSTGALIGAANGTAVVTDTTTGKVQSGTLSAGNSASTSVPLSAAIPAGDSVTVVITGSTNSSATSESVSVNTSTDLNPVASNSVALTAAAAGPGLSSLVESGVTTLTAQATTVNQAVISGSDYLLVSISNPEGTTGDSAQLPSLASDYTVTDGTTSAQVTGVVTTPALVGPATGTAGSQAHYAYFLSPISAALGDTLTVTVTGVINDSTAQTQVLQLLNLTSTAPSGALATAAASYTAASPAVPANPVFVYSNVASSANLGVWIPSGGTVPTMQTTAQTGINTLTSVLGTAITGLSITLSSSTVSAKNVVYTMNFTPTTTDSTGVITLSAGLGVAQAVSATLLNNTTGAYQAVTVTSGTIFTSSTGLVKGDAYTLVASGIQNNSTSGVTTIKVHTAADTVPVSTTFTLNAAPVVGPFVSLSDVNLNAASTWTISGIQAVAAFSGGVDTVEINSGGAGYFPAIASDYTVTDLTTASGSGAVTTVTNGNTSDVTITVPNSIVSGDNLEIVITNVSNGGTAGSSNDVVLTGNSSFISSSTTATLKGLAAPATSAPSSATPPNAATTGSNGALVNVNGTIYVYAGGVAFGIPTPADFNAISASVGNPTVVTASSVTTSGTVRNGTLLQVVGSPEIGVVSSGTYTGFSTASQFLSDGYSFANVIQVPNLGSLATGTGTPANAAATAADGALVNVSGTIYVYAGGVAMGIPTPAVFSTISAAEGNPTVVTATSVTTTGTMATGTLVQVAGSPQVNVETSTGTQVGFATASGFTSGGYSWGKVILIP